MGRENSLGLIYHIESASYFSSCFCFCCYSWLCFSSIPSFSSFFLFIILFLLLAFYLHLYCSYFTKITKVVFNLRAIEDSLAGCGRQWSANTWPSVLLLTLRALRFHMDSGKPQHCCQVAQSLEKTVVHCIKPGKPQPISEPRCKSQLLHFRGSFLGTLCGW